VIPNALSFYPETISSCEKKRAIAVGRLVYEKGFDILIDIWATLAKHLPDWELNIFGSGNQKEALQTRIKSLKLESAVHIHEPVKDIIGQYLEHSMLLFPSRYLEALPMALLEAESCGLPLVAFDAPCGPKDIIEDGKNGFLIPAGDNEAFAKRIIELAQSENLRKSMGKTARNHSLQYNEERIMKEWLDLFSRLLPKSH